MSINSQMNVERRLLSPEPSGNNPERRSPLINDYLPSMEFLNPLAITPAGKYDKTEKLPNPLKPWHRASKGATDRFKGCLSKLFPELKDLNEKDLKEIEKKRHDF